MRNHLSYAGLPIVAGTTCAMLFDQSAHLYDAAYAAKGKDYAADADRVRDLVGQHKRSPGLSLLDVACGTGEHLRLLRAVFNPVAGIDICPAMLTIARGKLPEVDLFEGDMAAFDLKRQFDVVTCLFSSIGYLRSIDAMRAAIECMGRHLVPGGVIILEPALTPGRLQPAQEQILTFDHEGNTVTRTTTAEHGFDELTITFTYIIESKRGTVTFDEQHLIQLFTDEMYIKAIADAGLSFTYDPRGIGMYVCTRP